MEWDAFVQAATATSWISYLGTIRPDGTPHVSVVAPGYAEGVVWFATRQSSRRFRNLVVNPAAAFHWPVDNHAGQGELIARGTASLHTSLADRHRLWHAPVLNYDPTGFFGSPDNVDLAFVEVRIDHARLLGPDFVAKRWVRSEQPG